MHIKKTLSFLAVLSILSLAPSMTPIYAQNAFGGTITWSVTLTRPQMGSQQGAEEQHPMIMNIKGDKTESEMDMGSLGGLKTYVDRAQNKMYLVMGANKTGRVYSLDNPATTSADNSVVMKPTGQKATIAGHVAEEYILKTPKQDISIWGSADLPKSLIKSMDKFMAEQPNQGPAIPAAFRQLSLKGLAPVKLVISMQGKTEVSMELVKYEEKSLDDALFVPPADVTFSDVPQRPGGMN